MVGAVTSLIHMFTGKNEIMMTRERLCPERFLGQAQLGTSRGRASEGPWQGGRDPGSQVGLTQVQRGPIHLGQDLTLATWALRPACLWILLPSKLLASFNTPQNAWKQQFHSRLHARCCGGSRFLSSDVYSPSERAVTQPHGVSIVMAPAAASTGA